MTNRRQSFEWAAVTIVAAAVGSYYLWQLRSAGYRFDWQHGQGGYYNYLGRAFASGHLDLPIKPSPELLALPNPWDPAANESYKMHDMALFHGRYYLYHGPGPAVLLFTPWLLLTSHDLPERFALFLFCFGGFLFSAAALIQLLALAGVKPGPALLALLVLALGLCQSVPYLLSRVWVYEIAIAGGYFFFSGAIFFLARGIRSNGRGAWLGASGMMFGLAISCRPHLGVAGVVALAALAILFARSRQSDSALAPRGLFAFAIAFGLVAAIVAAYNYGRFHDPFEFGLRYLLAGPNQNRINLTLQNMLPGLYYWLACSPDFGPVFPWARLAFRHPFNSPSYPFPPGYFIEATVGALYLAPFLVAALFPAKPPGAPRVRALLWATLTSAGIILLFLAATGFTTQRYEIDFLPAVILVALVNCGIHIHRAKGIRRTILCSALILTVEFGAVVNMALGISGPYDEMVKNRPLSYVRLARWFSPIDQFRPLLNPSVEVDFTVEFPSQPDNFREPLLTMGRLVHRHFLYVEHSTGKLRLVSRSDESTVVREIDNAGTPAQFRVTYAPGAGRLTAFVNGRELLVHDIGTLVTAPSEVTIGENRVESDVTVARFTGRIRTAVKSVRPA